MADQQRLVAAIWRAGSIDEPGDERARRALRVHGARLVRVVYVQRECGKGHNSAYLAFLDRARSAAEK
jgi:hypothetical protein